MYPSEPFSFKEAGVLFDTMHRAQGGFELTDEEKRASDLRRMLAPYHPLPQYFTGLYGLDVEPLKSFSLDEVSAEERAQMIALMNSLGIHPEQDRELSPREFSQLARNAWSTLPSMIPSFAGRLKRAFGAAFS